MSGRRGFTLIEIMLSLTLMLIVSGAIYRLIVSSQRISRNQAERMSLQSNVRIGSLAVLNDLRELNTMSAGAVTSNDILAMGPTSITYRGMRGTGFICQAPTATQIRIARNTFFGYRDPEPGRDSVYVFIDGDPDTEVGDAWLSLPLLAVSTATACPGILGDGITLTVPNTPALIAVPFPVQSGTPVRVFEVMELKLHQEDGRSWLGARSVSANEPVRPVLGPLVDGNGFSLTYLNVAGAATADPKEVKSIQVILRGISDGGVTSGIQGPPTHVQEELVSQITLRNSFRP
jgi:prepilin-type N-terminal cleavage/methylation domain-containing protein